MEGSAHTRRECASALRDGPGQTAKRCVPMDSTDQIVARSVTARTMPSAAKMMDNVSAIQAGWVIDVMRYVRKDSTVTTAWSRAHAHPEIMSATLLRDACAASGITAKSVTNLALRQRCKNPKIHQKPVLRGVWF